MPRLFLAEGEDLLARFHPHPASFWWRYSLDALWAAFGALALASTARLGVPDATGFPWAWFVFPVLAALGTALLLFLKLPGGLLGSAWSAGGVLLLLLVEPVGARLVPAAAGGLAFLLLGLACTALSILRTEFHRTRILTQVTTSRVVLRSGVSRITERTIDLEDVKGLRASQTPLGQAFGFGDITLVLEAPRRAKAVERLEPLVAAPRFDEVKHRLDTALRELRMPKREREKRTEDRRLKESMRALAGWVQRTPRK